MIREQIDYLAAAEQSEYDRRRETYINTLEREVAWRKMRDARLIRVWLAIAWTLVALGGAFWLGRMFQTWIERIGQ